MKVWVIEDDEYIAVAVAATVDKAIAYVKARYQDPYVVKWHAPLERDPAYFVLLGDFQAVDGYSTAHTTQYDFRQFEVL